MSLSHAVSAKFTNGSVIELIFSAYNCRQAVALVVVVGYDDAFVECIRAVRHTSGILRHKQNILLCHSLFGNSLITCALISKGID